MNHDSLRHHLIALLRGGSAHITFDDALANLPPDLRRQRPRDLPYSPWEQLEHMRIAQHDILEFSRDPDHQSPSWPDGYWPRDPAPPDEAAWDRSIESFRGDNQQMQDLILDTARDLFEPFPWGDGHTLLREALLVADHNSYHLGQLIVIRRMLGAWTD